ncbi:MAG: hybrid sensor histidine kinase/response regulator [Candidatus Marinimicrobia bacterium]|nr:hybrid sensor histidine kinase/response regulator [Candidatus Neomarinimicrobiota bacterium]
MSVLKVLVVDDELGMRLGMKKSLARHKINIPDIKEEITFDIEMAETGEEALEKVASFQPDVMLLDYKLPTMSGLEVLEEVTAEDSEMVTIMVTAYASLETAVSAIKRGAFDFLAKPFEPKELRDVVEKAARSLLLARQVKKLEEERRQVRFQFISVLGHELKAPINAVEGYLGILADKVLGTEIDKYDDMVSRSLVRIRGMKKMIADLLDLTRIESGQKIRSLEPVNVTEIAKHAMETSEVAAAEKNIKLNLHAAEEINMVADSGEIEIIMNNLISNAVKYNRDNGQVDVTITKEDHKITIAVQDTGIGMTREEADSLFSEFKRIKNEKTRNILGSGLGLSILKKISGMYHGDVSVSSQPDVGSTFTVDLHTT